MQAKKLKRDSTKIYPQSEDVGLKIDKRLDKIYSRSEDVGSKNRQETQLKQTRKARMQARKIDKILD